MTFTKERLTELSRRENVGAILGEEIAELARIALASLEAEPVAWLLSGGGAKNHVSFDSGNAYADPLREVTPLYTAPPAPVSVPDEDLLHMAASAIEDLLSNKDRSGAGVWADVPVRLRRAAMLQGAKNVKSRCSNPHVIPDCSCRTCRPVTISDMRFVVCPDCGNKRFPHANDHRNACTGSNEPGQEGSTYPSAPKQEVKP
ncbi:hypothetical protein [Enterobacter asburiae]|uniref:hypothetical protein n=1 Tax=Enterobacter asburiae TaxID=61645 RepID=UPI001BCD6FCE|nr:hypothetical protein [Enterobacter asburiae]